MKYRKKPIVIDAFKWTGGPDQTEDPEWIVAAIKSGEAWIDTVQLLDNAGTEPRVFIKTLEGTMEARPGDYIIKGIQGEIYPCKPDIFEASYEPVGENNLPPARETRSFKKS